MYKWWVGSIRRSSFRKRNWTKRKLFRQEYLLRNWLSESLNNNSARKAWHLKLFLEFVILHTKKLWLLTSLKPLWKLSSCSWAVGNFLECNWSWTKTWKAISPCKSIKMRWRLTINQVRTTSLLTVIAPTPRSSIDVYLNFWTFFRRERYPKKSSTGVAMSTMTNKLILKS